MIDAGLSNPGEVGLTSVSDETNSDDGGVSDVEVIDSDVANDPSTLEDDDNRVVASRDDEGNLHTGFVDEDSDGGVTNENVDPFDSVVLEPGDDGEQFERADDQTLPTVEQSSGSDSSGSSGSGSGSSSSSGSGSGSSGSSSGGGQGGNQSGIGPAVMPAGWSPDSGDGDGLDTQTMLMIGGLAVAGIGTAFVAGGGS